MFAGRAEFVLGERGGSVSKMFPVAVLFLVSICAVSSAQEVSTDNIESAALSGLGNSNLHFTNHIFKHLATKEGNIFFSPISIYGILALLYMGAGGETASQMARGLTLPEDNERIKTGFHALKPILKSDENITLEVAVKIFTDTSIPLKKNFQDIARTSFHSDVEAVSFKTNTEAARVQINEWVKGNTNNKIPELVANGDLTTDTVLVLANAIRFKGDWATKFDPANTRPAKFYLTPTQTKDVQMMYSSGKKFGFAVNWDLDCKMLQVPFKGDRLTLFMFLPDRVDGLPSLVEKLQGYDLDQLIDSFTETYVDISIPKFKLEESTDLIDAIKLLGMTNMFSPSANFTGLTDTPVHVSKIVHKAFIEINEDGAEATAATGAGVALLSSYPSFNADHPFLFSIFDKRLRTPLVVGRYVGQEN